MTGGRVVVLGKTGRNFAAGMSGGIAYVLDEHQLFDTLCNLEMVDLEPLVERADIRFVRDRIALHYQWTGSALAKRILDNWRDMVGKFVKVMPMDYRTALERFRIAESTDEEQPSLADEVLFNEEVVRG
jgi:glutamate synthase domain-containing protein 3